MTSWKVNRTLWENYYLAYPNRNVDCLVDCLQIRLGYVILQVNSQFANCKSISNHLKQYILKHLFITAKIATDYGVTDMADSMRIDMLAMAVEGSDHTVDSLKKTSGYLSTINDFTFTDTYLQELLDMGNNIKST